MAKKRQNLQLPDELVEEIFVRLPVKSLIRFTSLSKLWRSKIKSRSVGERHCLMRSGNQMSSLYVVKHSTQWWIQQILSPASLQQFIDHEKGPIPHDYKLVWSSNSAVCEVFEVWADTWRYVSFIPSFPTVIGPIYAKGSLHWTTQPCEDRIYVVSFDLLRETFRWIRQS